MVIWLTGQPGSGKTTIAQALKNKLGNVKLVDGDSIRQLFWNNDYTFKGRFYNVDIAQKIAHFLHNEGEIVIVSLVSPFINQREEFKQLLGDSVKEVYLKNTNLIRKEYMVKNYQPPKEDYLHIDTDEYSVEESLEKIITYTGI